MPRGRPVGSKNKPKAAVDSQNNTKSPITRNDGWDNVMVGLGQRQDRSKYTSYGFANIIDDETLSQMYLGDGLSSRIVDIIADDMTREWIDIDCDDEDVEDDLEKTLVALDTEEQFNKALRWQRLYGGALLLIGAMDGQSMDKPLRPDRIKEIAYLRPIDKTAVSISESVFDYDPSSATYGKILKYKVRFQIYTNQQEFFIHHTRVIPFFNDPIPDDIKRVVDMDQRYWGISSLQKINEELRDLGGITQSVVNLLYGFNGTTYKFEGLAELLAAGNEGKLVKRLEAINTSKSILNAVVLDKEEDSQKDYATVAGLPEVIDRYMLKLSGSTGIPVTRLFGRSPAGLNATGENDLRNYYDLIEANQRNRLMPPLRRFIDLIAAWKGYTTEIKIKFNTLYQLTEEERAKIDEIDARTEKIKAETELLYIDAGLRDGYEVAKEHGWESEYEEPIEPMPVAPEPNGTESAEAVGG